MMAREMGTPMEKIIYAGSVGIPQSLNQKKEKASVTGRGEGVYTLVYDGIRKLTHKETALAENTGIITLSPDGKTVYAANETRDFGGLPASGGGVTAFHVDETTGYLKKLNESLSYGSRPANLDVTEDGRYLLVANHGSHSASVCSYVKNDLGQWILRRKFDDASIAVFSIEDDGRIGQLSDLKVFEGCGYWCHGGGQSTSHLHTVRVCKDLVFACNRGADRIEVMKLDQSNGQLKVLASYQTRYGYAPRHLDLNREKNILYVCNENYPSVSVIAFDSQGNLKEEQLLPTMEMSYYQDRPLPKFSKPHADADEQNTCGFADPGAAMPADIHVWKDNRFLYVSNRCFSGSGSIAVYRILPDGLLQRNGVFPLPGKDPRGFQLLDKDKLIIAMMDTDCVQIYRTDAVTGMPVECLAEAKIPSVASFAAGMVIAEKE